MWASEQAHNFKKRDLIRGPQKSPTSLKFFRKMVSLTALKTALIFSVSTAVVKWWYSSFSLLRFTRSKKLTRNACTASKLCESPLNSGKYQLMSVSRFFNFSSSRSALFRNKMNETFLKITLFMIVSKMFCDSTKRFVSLEITNAC